MDLFIRFNSLFALALLSTLPCSAAGGEPFAFPWGAPQPAILLPTTPLPGYHVLPSAAKRHATLPIFVPPAKPAFAYGWFGSNPVPYARPSWGRHFGYSQNFTQWTSR